MKNTLLLLLFSCFLFSCENTIIHPEKVYEGSVFLMTQKEVNEFGAKGYTIIKGRLQIGRFEEANSSIINLDALNNLKEVEELFIEYNDELTNIDGLKKLTSVYHIHIENNDKLKNLDALGWVSQISHLAIRNNELIENVDGLINVKSLYSLSIYNNDNLSNLEGLANLVDIWEFVHVNKNNKLNNLCGLINLMHRPGSPGSYIYNVAENAFNPSQQEIKSGKCMK